MLFWWRIHVSLLKIRQWLPMLLIAVVVENSNLGLDFADFPMKSWDDSSTLDYTFESKDSPSICFHNYQHMQPALHIILHSW